MAGAEFIVVSGDTVDGNGNTPWEVYKAYRDAIYEKLGSDALYEAYMNGLIYIDADGNVQESEY